MKYARAVFLIVVSAFGAIASAADDPALAQAVGPLRDGVPEVAVVRLRALLAGDLTPEQRRAVNANLAEAELDAGHAEEALQLMGDPSLAATPPIPFHRAQALAHLRRWPEALSLYQTVAQDNASPFRADAIAGAGEALRALGRRDEALHTFALLFKDERWKTRAQLRCVELYLEGKNVAGAIRILEEINANALAERKEKRYLRGRVEAQQGNFEKAIELFRTLADKPAGVPHSVLVATLCALADAHLQFKTPEAGAEVLETYVERHPADPNLPLIFTKLDELYRAERKRSRHELGRWSVEPLQPRRALSQWYLARLELRAGRRENALQKFDELRRNHPPLPELAEALVESADLALEDQRFEDAVSILDAARALRPAGALLDRINFLTGQAQYSGKRFEAAARTFEQAARSSSSAAPVALFNASLAWLQLGDKERFGANSQAFSSAGGDEQSRGALQLEQAQLQAAHGEKNAVELLRSFLRDFPAHPRRSEAWVALAELAFHSAPTRIDEARQALARAAENQPTDAAKERADYLMIWIEDTAPHADEAKIVGLANNFLQVYPKSQVAQDVRLKLAEAYYRRQDFPSAQTQFELLARANPDGPLAEKALFFSAEAAMQSMGEKSLDRALTMFDEVVKRSGELKWAARNEQAVIERKLGRPQDALALYDEVLRGDGKPEAKREALCGKGDILYELGSGDPENYRRAIGIYNQVAQDSSAPAHWRNQALFKQGMALEKLEDRANALATFYKIIEDDRSPDRPREFFWYYKAGFNAAQILEDEAKWEPAAVVYQKLASAGGARSEEAKSRLSRIRLEHFLWDQ